MSFPIQKALKLAHSTFSKLSKGILFDLDSLSPLRSQLNQIRAVDVNFEPSVFRRDPTSFDQAPVTYVKLYEDKIISVGIFVMRRGARLPLHDHPGMFGLCKTIHGKMKVNSFSQADLSEDKVRKKKSTLPSNRINLVPVHSKDSVVLSEEDECCVLTPEEGNYHEISPVGDMAAFLDILAPPYDYMTMTRTCQYYTLLEDKDKVLEDSDKLNESSPVQWLCEIPEPNDFWCDTSDYTGPPLNVL